MEQFVKQLNTFQAINNNSDHLNVSKENNQGDIDIDNASLAVGKLYKLLEEDSINAGKYLETLSSYLTGNNKYSIVLEKLRKDVDNYDFENAIENLKTLAGEMGIRVKG
jgi:hypothetical protein